MASLDLSFLFLLRLCLSTKNTSVGNWEMDLRLLVHPPDGHNSHVKVILFGERAGPLLLSQAAGRELGPPLCLTGVPACVCCTNC